MNTNLLKYLLQTSETGNITEAAKILGISQSALSQQLKKLEKLIGTKLLKRHKTGISLTAAGKALLPYANKVLIELAEAKLVIQELEELEQSKLSIGVVQTVNINLMPAVISKFRKKYPNVSLEIFEGASDVIESKLLAGKFDLGIGLSDMPGFAWGNHEQFYTEPLFTEDLLVLVTHSHPLWSKNEVKMEDLENIAMVDIAPGTKGIWQDLCLKTGIKTKTIAEMTSISSAITSVSYLQAATVIPAVSLLSSKETNIKGILITDLKPTRTIGCLWRRHQYRSLLSIELITILRESIGSLNNPNIQTAFETTS